MERATVKVEQPQDRDLWVPCGPCNSVTRHRQLALITSCQNITDELSWESSSVIQCQGCDTVSFCVESRSTWETACNPDTGEEEPVVYTQLYPNRLAGRPRLQHEDYLERRVGEVYEETHGAIVNEQRILGGMGIWTIVEAVCQDKKVVGRNLEEKIAKLSELGHITPAGAWILHGIRYMGNDAAHEVKAHTKEELANALEVVEHLLTGVYILPALAALFPSDTMDKMHRGPSAPLARRCATVGHKESKP